MQLFGLEAVGLIRYSKHYNTVSIKQAVPCPETLLACLLPWRHRLKPHAIHVGFVVYKLALAQIFLRVPRFSPVSTIPSIFHTHPSITDAIQHSISNRHASFNAILSKTLCRVITITKVGTARKYFHHPLLPLISPTLSFPSLEGPL